MLHPSFLRASVLCCWRDAHFLPHLNTHWVGPCWSVPLNNFHRHYYLQNALQFSPCNHNTTQIAQDAVWAVIPFVPAYFVYYTHTLRSLGLLLFAVSMCCCCVTCLDRCCIRYCLQLLNDRGLSKPLLLIFFVVFVVCKVDCNQMAFKWIWLLNISPSAFVYVCICTYVWPGSKPHYLNYCSYSSLVLQGCKHSKQRSQNLFKLTGVLCRSS